MQHQTIFARKFLRKTMDDQFILDKEIEDLDTKRAVIDNWVAQINSGRIDRQKEKSTQADFLNKIFGDVLGYTYDTHDKWLLHKEVTTPIGGKSADGALGVFRMTDGEKDLSDVRVAIELKDARTHLDKAQNRQGNRRTPVEQAFDYANKFGESCKWVIVSNFKEIRLYNKSLGPARYESWELTTLNDPEQSHELQRFFFLMQKGRLFWEKGVSFVDKILKDRQEEELNISHKFYVEYKNNRIKLLKHLKKHNPKIDELTLFEKTQKLLDRIIFICFCEDYDIIPLRTFNRLIQLARTDIFDSSDDIFYKYVKNLFQNVNEGSRKSRINRFNGGLFADDPILDNLIIKDDCLEDIILMSRYDFATDMNVNILGHIFEQSISDLEVLKAQITGESIDNQGKRKQDGIFYTPEYITRYIVEQAVGGWLNDRKTELGETDLPDLSDEDYDSLQNGGNERIKAHIRFWQQYAEALRNIKVIDPACGSGAFLNQVFDFLYKENQIVRNELDKLSLENDPTPLDKYILTNNIYGVDLNHESVQITKLSLWLKTANKHSALTALDQNILIGNSLIDDPKVAGKLAFKWKKRFKAIFDKGGFDIVVGNPPYGASFNKNEKEYFRNTYSEIHMRTPESFNYFLFKIEDIVNQKGKWGVIIPSSFLYQYEFEKTRKYLLENSSVSKVLNLGDDVFEDVATPTCIISISKEYSDTFFIDLQRINRKLLPDEIFNEADLVPANDLITNDSYSFIKKPHKKLIDKCFQHTKLKEIAEEVATGISSGLDKAYVFTQQKIDELKIENTLMKPLLIGGEINRYFKTPTSTKKILYITSEDDIETFPVTKSLLEFHKEKLIKRREAANGKISWYSLNWPRRKKLFDNKKILIRQTASRILACIDEEGWYCLKSAIIVQLPDNHLLSYDYLLALLNSKLIDFLYQDLVGEGARIFPEVKPVQLFKLPIKEASKDEQNKIKILVDKIMSLNSKKVGTITRFHRRLQDNLGIEKFSKKLRQFWEYDFKTLLAELKKNKITLTLKQQDEWAAYFDEYKADLQALETEIDRTDAEIDRMVYALYGLTEEEIQIVETSL